MIRAVIDTNVWVAGILSTSGPPARIVDAIVARAIVPVVSPAILAEYTEVFQRSRLRLPAGTVGGILAYLRLPGTHVIHADPQEIQRVCADPDDDVFIAAAADGGADYLVTGNTRHFPTNPWRGVRIVDPARFLQVAGLANPKES